MAWVYLMYLYQNSGGATPTTPRTIDPGNDPFLTLFSTLAFLAISIGGGVIWFNWRNPHVREMLAEKKRKKAALAKQKPNGK